MNTKEKYTIAEATELLGFKSRSTINKRTKGQGGDAISYERDENGTKVISIIELQRVFPDKLKRALSKKEDTAGTSTSHSAKAQSDTAKNTINTVWLAEKVELLEELLVKEQAERDRERQEFKDREKKGEGREGKLYDQISELTKTLSQQTRLLEHHQKVDTRNKDTIQTNPSNKVLQSTSSELASTLKFAGFASTAMITLLIVVYFYQSHKEELPKQKKMITQKYQTPKMKSTTRISPTQHMKKNYRNYTPIPR